MLQINFNSGIVLTVRHDAGVFGPAQKRSGSPVHLVRVMVSVPLSAPRPLLLYRSPSDLAYPMLIRNRQPIWMVPGGNDELVIDAFGIVGRIILQFVIADEALLVRPLLLVEDAVDAGVELITPLQHPVHWFVKRLHRVQLLPPWAFMHSDVLARGVRTSLRMLLLLML